MGLVDRIKMKCSKKKITVSGLEKRAGLADNCIYKWEKHSPSIDKVQKVAVALECTVDELLE